MTAALAELEAPLLSDLSEVLVNGRHIVLLGDLLLPDLLLHVPLEVDHLEERLEKVAALADMHLVVDDLVLEDVDLRVEDVAQVAEAGDVLVDRQTVRLRPYTLRAVGQRIARKCERLVLTVAAVWMAVRALSACFSDVILFLWVITALSNL